MKISVPAFLAYSLASFSFAAAAVIPRQTADCIGNFKAEGIYLGQFSHACLNLVNDCLQHVNTTTSLWSVKSCVAAATCDGTRNLGIVARCDNSAVPTPTDQPHLDYNIYAGIVGDCAWQPGGCPITPQNYIDFIYGSLSDIGSTDWPTSADDVRTRWWGAITSWAATGDNVPYHNFDDWLHYSNS